MPNEVAMQYCTILSNISLAFGPIADLVERLTDNYAKKGEGAHSSKEKKRKDQTLSYYKKHFTKRNLKNPIDNTKNAIKNFDNKNCRPI